MHTNIAGGLTAKCQMIVACMRYYCGVIRCNDGQVVAANMQLDILLFMHMKCLVGADDCKIMLHLHPLQECSYNLCSMDIPLHNTIQ